MAVLTVGPSDKVPFLNCIQTRLMVNTTQNNPLCSFMCAETADNRDDLSIYRGGQLEVSCFPTQLVFTRALLYR